MDSLLTLPTSTRARTHTNKTNSQCEILSSYSGGAEDASLFGDMTLVSSGKWFPPFRRIVVPSSLGQAVQEELWNILTEGATERPSKSEARCSKLRWTGRVRHMGEKRNACRILARKPEK